MTSNPRKSTALPLNDALLAEARALGIDVSDAVEDGLARAIRTEKERRWRIENADAIRAEREYVEKHGLPLARYRQF